MSFRPPSVPLEDWHIPESHLICAFQSFKNKNENCHKGKRKMQHQPNCHLGTRQWQVPYPPAERRASRPAAPTAHGDVPFTGTGFQYLPFLSTLSLHPSTPWQPEEKLHVIWLTSTPTESDWCRVHPSGTTHRSGADKTCGTPGSETYPSSWPPRTGLSSPGIYTEFAAEAAV